MIKNKFIDMLGYKIKPTGVINGYAADIFDANTSIGYIMKSNTTQNITMYIGSTNSIISVSVRGADENNFKAIILVTRGVREEPICIEYTYINDKNMHILSGKMNGKKIMLELLPEGINLISSDESFNYRTNSLEFSIKDIKEIKSAIDYFGKLIPPLFNRVRDNYCNKCKIKQPK